MLRASLTTATLLVAAALGTATAAHASTSVLPGPQSAHTDTIIQDRPDGGNGSPNPYWADDSFTRTLTITRTGGSPGDWTFTATILDQGTFVTIKGAQAPNQGPGYAGDLIKAAVKGTMFGYADFSFTASKLPSSAPGLGVPFLENDHGGTSGPATSTWYELAFPHGTVFGGPGMGDWAWFYYAGSQHWTDAWNNNYGDSAGDGQITG